jgi:hypothetical protein
MLTAQQHLQREWLNARCHILEIAAILDRIDRAGGAAVATDPVYQQIQAILRTVGSPPVLAERTSSILEQLGAPR